MSPLSARWLVSVSAMHSWTMIFGWPVAWKSADATATSIGSVSFHRRFTSPTLAFSETTAYPANALSANNMAAKLVISTMADVRNTMFMSGLTPLPESYWAALAPAMRNNANHHQRIAGHRLR